MKTQWLIVAAIALPVSFAFATGAGAPSPSFAQVPPPEAVESGADAGVDGSADQDGGVDGGDKRPPSYPSFAQIPFSDEKTPKPKDKEWATAERVSLDREPSVFQSTCEARRLREWIRIRCAEATGSIALLGGNPEGLSMTLDPIKEEWASFPDAAEMVFPVRRGDRRAIEWLTVEFGYKGANSLVPFFVLFESWLPGEESPTILVR